MAAAPTLANEILGYDQATGATLDPNAPWTASNWDTPGGQHSQFEDWAQKQLGYAPDWGTNLDAQTTLPINMPSSGSGSGSGASGGSGNQITPSLLSQLFPNGIPQASVATAGSAPDLVQQILSANGALPKVSAPSIMGQIGDKISPDALMKAVSTQMQPEFQQQDQALTESLANAGIVGGSTTGAQTNLANQQTQTLSGALAPFEQAAQQMELTGTTADANNSLSASGQNAGNAIGVGSTLAQMILGNNQFNAGALNNGNQFNISNLLNAAQYDTGTSNSFLDSVLGMQNQDWLAQLGLQGQMAAGAAGGQTGSYQPVYQQPAPVNFSGFGGAFAPMSKPSSPAPQPTAPNYTYSGGNNYT